MWKQLKSLCANVILSGDRDRYAWLSEKRGQFSVKSMYLEMKTKQIPSSFKEFWWVQVPRRS
jgi:hypothetical protein